MCLLVIDWDIMLSDVIDILWKERLNNFGQQCHQYHLTQKRPRHMTFEIQIMARDRLFVHVFV